VIASLADYESVARHQLPAVNAF